MELFLLSEMITELEWFWGSAAEAAAPSTSERKAKMGEALVSAVKYGTVDKTNNPILRFGIGRVQATKKKSSDTTPRIFVCEAAYLAIIGNPDTGAWKGLKTKILDFDWKANGGASQDEELEKLIRMSKCPKEMYVSEKEISSRLFIEYIAEFSSDTSPMGIDENIRILPYEKVSQLFHEYTVTMAFDGEPSAKSKQTPFLPNLYLFINVLSVSLSHSTLKLQRRPALATCIVR